MPEECNARIILIGIDEEGNRNSRFEYDFPLVIPVEKDVCLEFRNGFRKAFNGEHVSFEGETVFLPLGISSHWQSYGDLASYCKSPCVDCLDKGDCFLREFFLAKYKQLCFEVIDGKDE